MEHSEAMPSLIMMITEETKDKAMLLCRYQAQWRLLNADEDDNDNDLDMLGYLYWQELES